MEVKGYSNRRGGYEKLDGSIRQRRKKSGNHEVVAEPVRKWRSSWRIRLTAPLKLDKVVNVREAKKFCGGLRDAYVDFMNRNVDVRIIAEGMGGGYVGHDGFGIPRFKEYDEKMIMEMHNSVAPIVSS